LGDQGSLSAPTGATMSLFGQSSGGGGGLFGGGQQQQQAGGGLFGSSTPQQSSGGGGLFGNSSTPQQQQNGGGGLFGGSNKNNNNSTQQSGGLFGGSNTTTQNQSGGGLFGGGNTATPNQSSGGLFGGSSATPSGGGGGGLFGSSNNNTTNTSGGLFGNTTQQNQSGGGGGLFGNTQQQNNSGGLFGASGGGLFGNNNNQQQQQSGGLFGGNNAQQQNTFGGVNNAAQQPMQFQAQNNSMPWWYRELVSIQNAYKPGEKCRFQTMLYEVLIVAPDLVLHNGAVPLSGVDSIKAQRKREVLQAFPWIDEREWQRAEDKNPDPENWMPSPVIGINSLFQRAEQQADHVRTQLAMLTRPAGKRNQQSQQQPNDQGQGQALIPADETKEDSSEQLWLNLEVEEPQEQIEQCRHGLIRLKHRLIKALGRLERIQSASKRGGRSAGEVELDQRLTKLQAALEDPRGCRAQLTSIVTQLEMEDCQNSSLSLSEIQPGSAGSLASEEQDRQAIYGFLEMQREGIDNLMKVVKRDMRDLEIIKRRTSEYNGY